MYHGLISVAYLPLLSTDIAEHEILWRCISLQILYLNASSLHGSLTHSAFQLLVAACSTCDLDGSWAYL